MPILSTEILHRQQRDNVMQKFRNRNLTFWWQPMLQHADWTLKTLLMLSISASLMIQRFTHTGQVVREGQGKREISLHCSA
jgi:hypothetical protein